jgi:hypothetical protein
LVGVARKDGERGAKAVIQYLQTLPPLESTAQPNPVGFRGGVGAVNLDALTRRLEQSGKPVVTKADVKRLEEVEHAEAKERGLEEFKYASNQEMLEALGLVPA